MTIDQNTGLPQLPEGYFWRVEHPKRYAGWNLVPFEDKTALQVRLMRVLSDKTQDPLSLYTQECKGVSSRAIVNAAYRILKRQTNDKRVASKLGDYPPNKLEK